MKIKRIAPISLSTLVGIGLTYILNFFVLENIIIPDPCYYHSHDTNIVFDIFYEMPDWNGDHPFPTIFNFIFTLTIGALLGLTLAIYILRIRDKKKKKRFDFVTDEHFRALKTFRKLT